MKKALLVITSLSLLAASPGDRVINNPNPGKDILIITKDANGADTEVQRFSAPSQGFGEYRSIGEPGKIPVAQGTASLVSNFPTSNYAHYTMDTNLVGTGSNLGGTLTAGGGVTFTNKGFMGRSASTRFNGSSTGYAVCALTGNRCTDNTFWNITATDRWAIGGWFWVDNWQEQTATYDLVGIHNDSPTTKRGPRVVLDPAADQLRFLLANSADITALVDLASMPNFGITQDWHHVAITYDGTTAKAFFDGQLIGSLAYSGQPTFGSDPLFQIGAINSGHGNFTPMAAQDVFFWKGSSPNAVTDVQINKIYSSRFTNHTQIARGHTLTQESFAALGPYNGQSNFNDSIAFWNFNSTNTRFDQSGATSCTSGATTCDFTATANPSFTAIGVDGTIASAPEFNGTSTYFTQTDAGFFGADNVDYSVGCWVLSTDVSNTERAMFSTFDSATDRGFIIRHNGSTGYLTTYIATSASSDLPAINVRADQGYLCNITGYTCYRGRLPSGKWMHVALTHRESDGLHTLYINGTTVGQKWDGNSFNSARFTVGARFATTPTDFWKGYIQDCFFARKYFSGSDIALITAAKLNHNKAISSAYSVSGVMRSEDQSDMRALYNPFLKMTGNAIWLDVHEYSSGASILIK